MLIYRIAKDGYGPYQYYRFGRSKAKKYLKLSADMGMRHNRSADHPIPPIILFNGNKVCGFESLDQLKEWFDGFLPRLHRLGFKIYVYKKRKFEKYVNQVLFRKSKIHQILSIKDVL